MCLGTYAESKGTAMRTYYILAQRTDGRWAIEFGDYSRATVDAERADYRDHDVKACDLKVIRVAGDTQTACDAAIAALNG